MTTLAELLKQSPMPEGSDPDYGQKWMPSQSLSEYQPTWRDRFSRLLMGDNPGPETKRTISELTGSTGLGSSGIGYIDVNPLTWPLAAAFGANDAWHKGDDKAIAMALIPGAPKAAGAVETAAAKGIRAYHGSPHDFDRFDISKIGTGEGAQAFGHGLYFAEAEDVAKTYKNAGPEASRQYDIINGKLTRIARELDKYRGGEYGKFTDPRGYELKAEYDKLLADRSKVGKTYEVSINAHPDDFLDWDKPLSQQSEKVRGALEGYFNLDREHQAKIDALSDRFRQKYGVASSDPEQILAHINSVREQALSSIFGRGKAREALDDGFELGALLKNTKARDNPLSGPVSSLFSGEKEGDIGRASALRDAGIPGIKYLDQGSRTAGEGSRNYVVFDDKIIDIVKKYGIATAASIFGLDAVNKAVGAAQDDSRFLLPGKQ